MIIKPQIFQQFPEVIAAQSTRVGGVSPMPHGLNLSSHVGDEPENVAENRKRFYEAVGVSEGSRFVYQNQIHSANINVVHGDENLVPESDALITAEPNVFLAVSVDRNAASWKRMVADRKEWTPLHISCAPGRMNGLIEPYHILSIPRYVLIDKQGRIAQSFAPQPSSGDRIYEAIRLLMEDGA